MQGWPFADKTIIFTIANTLKTIDYRNVTIVIGIARFQSYLEIDKQYVYTIFSDSSSLKILYIYINMFYCDKCCHRALLKKTKISQKIYNIACDRHEHVLRSLHSNILLSAEGGR